MPILEVRGLVKSYGRRRVVDGVSFDVDVGEVVGLLGPNGAGKTTSFRMTTGQIAPNDGQVLFNGQDVTRLPMYRRARLGMGYLSQETSVFRKLTVEQNIALILQMQPLSRRERAERTEMLMEKLHIAHLRHRRGMLLSGGERRRAEIARALATQPSFILLDEPFTGVDPIALDDIQQIISTLRNEGIGILLTDHSVRETLSITDRAYIIYEGKILTSGPSAKLPDDPIARQFYLGQRFNL